LGNLMGIKPRPIYEKNRGFYRLHMSLDGKQYRKGNIHGKERAYLMQMRVNEWAWTYKCGLAGGDPRQFADEAFSAIMEYFGETGLDAGERLKLDRTAWAEKDGLYYGERSVVSVEFYCEECDELLVSTEGGFYCDMCCEFHEVSDFRKEDETFVYLVYSRLSGDVKIGHSKNPVSNLVRLQCGNPTGLELKEVVRVKQGALSESLIHGTLESFRVGGEWFSAAIAEDVLAYFRCLRERQPITAYDERGSEFFKRLLLWES